MHSITTVEILRVKESKELFNWTELIELITFFLALHLVGFQWPPWSTQPLKSLDMTFSTSSILGIFESTYKGPTKKE